MSLWRLDEDGSATALQLSYASHDGVEILIPTTFGTEIAETKRREKAQSSDVWTEERFLAEILVGPDRARSEELLRRVKGLDLRGESAPVGAVCHRGAI
jgi:hypothetical protein